MNMDRVPVWLQRILREPATLMGLVTAVIGAAVLFGVHISDKQVGGLMLVITAALGFLRYILNPSWETLVQQKPGEAPTIVTDKFGLSKGEQAWVTEATPGARDPLVPGPGEQGALDLLAALVVVLISLVTGIGLIVGWQIMLVALVVGVVAVFCFARWHRQRRPSSLTFADSFGGAPG